jgi:plastocyanin
MNRIVLLGMGILLAGSALGACSSDSGNNTGAAGSTGSGGAAGGSTGNAGTTGAAGQAPGGSTGTAGGSGGSVAFTAVDPCPTEADYDAGTAISFPSGGLNYSPKCLKVSRGATVTFSGTFSSHPLRKSAMRGNTTSNPIVDTDTGTSTTVTFPASGFYAYYCLYHGLDSSGDNMAGVVWVQ